MSLKVSSQKVMHQESKVTFDKNKERGQIDQRALIPTHSLFTSLDTILHSNKQIEQVFP